MDPGPQHPRCTACSNDKHEPITVGDLDGFALVFARVIAALYCDCKAAGDRVLRMIGSISHQAKSLPTRLLLSHPPSHHLPEMQGDAKGIS